MNEPRMAKRTQKQRILDRLRDGEWRSTYELAHPDGGREILYPICRKEDLEKMGFVIEQRQREGSAQSEWRLVGGPVGGLLGAGLHTEDPLPRNRPAPTLFVRTEQGWR